MSIDVSEVLSAISEGSSAAIAVAMAWIVAWVALRAVKMLRDDGSGEAYSGELVQCPDCGEWGGDDEAACIEEMGACMGCCSAGADDGEDLIACADCDEPQSYEAWQDSGGVCLSCGAPDGSGWFTAARECENCGAEIAACIDDPEGMAARYSDQYELLCPRCAGDERV